ncbi:ribonuclease HII [Evansella sp. AB-P1]|uniref:ribonuclease HII n=1 Tax=Evansella sp. AB-P1 TaxID=3037653 RepID=UPI00241F3713|nr:ribonuclease HII [Evansella sp. AB-P1]MDG5788209.1 ribonuclease HII [Evansella sp. AB-P1]
MTKVNTIDEIRTTLSMIEDIEDPFIKSVQTDDRKGVQKLYDSWYKKYKKNQEIQEMFYEMREHEEKLWADGFHYIGGVDEVGRGPLAGPVIASCVVLSPNFYLPGLTDSKKLSKEKREYFFRRIQENALAIAVGMATAAEIDQINIYEATKLAMNRAIHKVNVDYLLLDAMTLTNDLPQTSLIKGDSKSISIAASSIIAKVTRDNYMTELSTVYPQYGFEKHMGYGTKEHIHALRKHGVTKEHRSTFSPVKEAMSLFD